MHKTPFSADQQVSDNAEGETHEATNAPAMSEQQRRYTKSSGALTTYKEFTYGAGSWFGFAAFELCSLVVTNLPGLPGYASRRILLPKFFKKCGKGPTIGRSVVLRQPQNISIGSNVIVDDFATLDVRSTSEASSELELGNHVFIGRHSIIAAKGGTVSLSDGCNISSSVRIASQSDVTLGKSVLVASYAYIGPGNHGTSEKDKPIIEQDMELRGGVTIGDYSWIGTRATIVDGVRIGKNAIIGAHSLVLEDVPDNAVVAGTPAKVIRYRE